MAFFFPALSAQGPPKSKGNKQASPPDPEGDDSNDEVKSSCQQHKSILAFQPCDWSRRETTKNTPWSNNTAILWNLKTQKRASIKKLPTPIQKTLHLNCFWVLFLYLLHQVCSVEVRRNFFQCLHILEMPAKLQKHLNASAVYPTIETVGGNPVRLVISARLPLLARETLFDLEVDL